MALVEFQYNGIIYEIQCQEGQKVEEICNNFINKSKTKENEIYYCYDGKVGTQFDKQLTFIQMANSLDKSRKRMNILVYDFDNNNDNKSKIKSKNIICTKIRL